MQNLSTRLVFAVLIFWGGLHFIGWGIVFAGVDVPGNPVWPALSHLFDFELSVLSGLYFILKIAAGLAALGGVVWVVFAVSSWVSEYRDQRKSSAHARRVESLPPHPKPIPTQSQGWEPQSNTAPAPSPNVQAITQAIPIPEPIPEPRPVRPSAKELKKRAIEQITRGY